jgi:threonine synthase
MPATYLTHLECSSTGDSFSPTELHRLSPAGKPLLARYNLTALARDLTREVFATRPRGMWRWRELLPLPLAKDPVTLGEGDTPLLPAPRLGQQLGLKKLWVKDEAVNPTGSFKARGLSAAITMAQHLGARVIVVPSAGNAGGAVAAYAARAGLPAHVFVPADTPEVNQLEVGLYGGHLERIDGLIDACGKRAAEVREELGAFDMSTLKEPYRLEGKKTMGLELAEQLGWKLPDVIMYPTGGGTGLIGMHKAFGELMELGWLERGPMPRFVSVQATGCAPIVRAFESGATHAEPWADAQTLASGLRVPGAVGDFIILDILRSTAGTAVAVTEDAWREGMLQLGKAEGVTACPEGGACVAAVTELRAREWISPDDEVVVFNTGAGTKYLEVLRQLQA